MKNFLMQDGRSSDIREKIAVGCVLKGVFDETDDVTPKPGFSYKLKRFVIIGEDESGNLLALLLINSRPRTGSSIIDDLQYPISPSKHPQIVEHSSYIDCSKIREKSIDEILLHANIHEDFYLEKIDEEELDIIRRTVAQASTIKPIVKKRFKLI